MANIVEQMTAEYNPVNRNAKLSYYYGKVESHWPAEEA